IEIKKCFGSEAVAFLGDKLEALALVLALVAALLAALPVALPTTLPAAHDPFAVHFVGELEDQILEKCPVGTQTEVLCQIFGRLLTGETKKRENKPNKYRKEEKGSYLSLVISPWPPLVGEEEEDEPSAQGTSPARCRCLSSAQGIPPLSRRRCWPPWPPPPSPPSPLAPFATTAAAAFPLHRCCWSTLLWLLLLVGGIRRGPPPPVPVAVGEGGGGHRRRPLFQSRAEEGDGGLLSSLVPASPMRNRREPNLEIRRGETENMIMDRGKSAKRPKIKDRGGSSNDRDESSNDRDGVFSTPYKSTWGAPGQSEIF
ncbi:hypothetical protein Taro_040857, partial [Colocasia esculenta]|nr:hypothetical protein [Colocasia esculenta]